MTKENSERLLAHYEAKGMVKAAADMKEAMSRAGYLPAPKKAETKKDSKD